MIIQRAMHPILEQIFATKTFTNSNNEVVPIHSETSAEQCRFLQQLIRENGSRSTIEIGLAYGMSTLAILEAVKENKGKAVAIDPYENTYWGGNGLDLVKQAGYEGLLEFVEEVSYLVLPRFVERAAGSTLPILTPPSCWTS